MKHTPYLKLFAIASVLCGPLLNAATTDPMGGMVIPIKGASDTRISIPFSRGIVFEGRIDSLSGSTITALGTPAWADDQFIYGDADSLDPANTYYMVFLTGPKEGLALEITANDASSITVALGNENLTGVQSESVDGAGNGDVFQIIPYWTPASLFASATLPDQTQILVYDNSTINTFKAPEVYTYFDASSNWGDTSFNLVNDAIIYPGEGLIVKTPPASSDLSLTVSGAVPMFQNRQVVASDTSANDLFYGVYSPIDVTLGTSNLGIQDGTQILLYDNTASGYFKAPEVYTYFAASENWGDTSFNLSNDVILPAGGSFILRKPSTGSNDSVEWTYLPNYLQ
ncbi:TIGR02597 family protein [Cerasicoccus arenae]|uniref:WxL domain-containing protein n=1 Tax=Cerasicoccus arenae TaxID=424488 RepID=A0A8J3DCN7_9BACT|nr:TIGR02597 family protein [Cerasicoccus arenae]MBK1858952.1 TIGR02597 family protein [Cerasicoccus arenae]GHC04052.1 hypothetical protein GCM10007047_20870 [Cerasicoccus arenae]